MHKLWSLVALFLAVLLGRMLWLSLTTPEAAEYFQTKAGTVMTFQGIGNEFAGFTVHVLYANQGKVEWRTTSGGASVAEVFTVRPNDVTRTYRKEAADMTLRINEPPNLNEILVKGPIRPGTTWQSGGFNYRIIDTDATFSALGRTLKHVLVVEARSENTVLRTFYTKAYGMVGRIFESGGSKIESRLVESRLLQ
jgi:hypothetical protein